jgi:protein N-terminal methyltransferase
MDLDRFRLTRRSSAKWVEIFHAAGLQVIKEEVQIGMPGELFVVKA